ncbi:MAG TPA: hypothetical protein VNJ08_11765 [Bacteriovoracaceae bacterium]|nr:hypothetical protein [Bacteriovoracaceae bacterium]
MMRFLLSFLMISSAYSQVKDPLSEWAENKKKWVKERMMEGATKEKLSKLVDFYFPVDDPSSYVEQNP